MAGKVCLIKRTSTGEKTIERVYEEFISSRKLQNVRPATLDFYYWNLKPFRDYLNPDFAHLITEYSNKYQVNSVI